MTAALKRNLISVDDYLADELVSQVKYEYLGGVVYAMAGARIGHNIIQGNIFAALHSRLRGKRCRPFNSDMKIRIQLADHVRFYYPDVSVICNSNLPNDSYQDEPAVIFEVVSRSTVRIDEGEKKDAYLTIPSLKVYVLVEQETASMVVFRRTANGFVREVIEGLGAVLPLGEIGAELPLAEVYEGVTFTPEPAEDEEV